MPETVNITVNGRPASVAAGTSVLAAILMSGREFVRRSVRGEPRGPLCAMGVCFECRATIDEQRHRRTCLILCREGMQIRVDE